MTDLKCENVLMVHRVRGRECDGSMRPSDDMRLVERQHPGNYVPPRICPRCEQPVEVAILYEDGSSKPANR